MSYPRYILLLLSYGLALNVSLGQESDTSALVLEEIKVTDTRLEQFTIGEKIEAVPFERIALLEYGNLSELLGRYSGVNIRSYGVSGLSSASLRGTGSNHTAVLWEGINLQSPMNGGFDLTQVPVSFIDKVSVQYGGAGSLFGSGAMGGAVHLNSGATEGSRGFSGKVFQQIGSFGSAYTGVNLYVKEKKIRTILKGFVNHADNNFNYYNRFSARNEEQQNAGIDQHGILSETYVRINNTNQISLKYWYQDNLVQIPKAASAGLQSTATQSDEFHRAVVNWQNKTSRRQLNLQTALLAHQLVYDNSPRTLSESQSISWISELRTTFKIKNNFLLDAGLNNTYEQAEVASYGGQKPSRNRTALYLSSKMLVTDHLELSLSVRESYDDGQFSPFLPSLGVNYAVTNDIHLKSKVARSYRIPTFNDLYWAGAGAHGNPDLTPEQGWSGEGGISINKRYHQFVFSAEATAFSNTISQWIQWVPDSAWVPVNVQKVWARGGEVSAEIGYVFSPDWQMKGWGNYNYTRSTKQAIDREGNPEELGKQVIYTPEHQGKVSADLVYRNLSLGYGHVFMGRQFTEGDNKRALDPYSVAEVWLTYRLHVANKHTLICTGKINNLMDENYEVRSSWYMPGRNYNFSVAYKFN